MCEHCKKCQGKHATVDHWKHREWTQDNEKLLRAVGPIGYERDEDDPLHPDYVYEDPAWCDVCNCDTAYCNCAEAEEAAMRADEEADRAEREEEEFGWSGKDE